MTHQARTPSAALRAAVNYVPLPRLKVLNRLKSHMDLRESLRVVVAESLQGPSKRRRRSPPPRKKPSAKATAAVDRPRASGAGTSARMRCAFAISTSRISSDVWDDAGGNIVEHIAGIDDFETAMPPIGALYD